MAISKIITCTLIGLILAIYFTSKDLVFKKIVAIHATKFLEANFDCSAKLEIDSINILNGTCILKEFSVKPHIKSSQDWSWRCRNLHFKIDWLDFFWKRKFKLNIKLENLEIHTYYHKNFYDLAIYSHLYDLLFTPSTLPIEIHTLAINTGTIEILNHEHNHILKLNWQSETKLLENLLKTNLYLKNSSMIYNQTIYCDQLMGYFKINLPLDNTSKIDLKSDLRFLLPKLDQTEQYFLNTKFEHNQINSKLSSLNGKIDLSYIINLNNQKINLEGVIPNFCDDNLISLQATMPELDQIRGKLKIQNLGSIKFKRHNKIWTGKANWQKFDLNLPIHWRIDEQAGQFETKFDLKKINAWLTKKLPNIINCEGKLVINGNFKQDRLNCSVDLYEGNLVLPIIYNAIKNFHSEFNFNFKNQILSIDKTTFTLHQGQIQIPNTVIDFSTANFFKSLHLPIIFTNCFISYNKQLSSSLSGRILYQKNPYEPDRLTGFISLEQALCKYNLLSGDFENLFNDTTGSKPTLSLNPMIDLNIFTLSPIKIRSTSLETNAVGKLHLINQLLAPEIIGEINLIDGKIIFPYKPLYINHGNLHFAAEQSYLPVINLTAKNRIKNHNITMQINGSVKNPQINFEASPSLTNEAIGALLLVGSENSSLNSSMPKIIMQNLNQILFGLNHVKFIPSFNDEAGRPAITGALEIDLGDRLHASIKKNFSAQEDTKFEVDYDITDDVSIRGIKDERGDLGGEIEIRLRV